MSTVMSGPANGNPASLATTYNHVVVQPTTLCNLDCDYCYLPLRKQRQVMPTAVAEALAASIAAQDSTHVTVSWHGGEPTAAGLDGLAALCEPFEELRQAGRMRHTIQTNGTLINAEWCAFLADQGFNIGVSLDGPPELNAGRHDWNGREAFSRAMRGVQALQDVGLEFDVICVVSPQTVNHAPELMAFFERVGPYRVGFNIEEREGTNADREIVAFPDAFGFWQAVIQCLREGSPLQVRELERAANYVTAVLDGSWRPSRRQPTPTVAANGDVTVLSPELMNIKAPEAYGDFVIGNILDDDLTMILQRAASARYVTEFHEALAECSRSCSFWAACQGAQASNRFFEHGTFAVTETAHCRNTVQAVLFAVHAATQEEISMSLTAGTAPDTQTVTIADVLTKLTGRNGGSSATDYTSYGEFSDWSNGGMVTGTPNEPHSPIV